jgi:hypothetical protein
MGMHAVHIVLGLLVVAERRRLIKLRRDQLIGDEVLLRIQRELDLEELRLS